MKSSTFRSEKESESKYFDPSKVAENMLTTLTSKQVILSQF